MLLSLRLLGAPAVQFEREWHELPVGLPSALLYYLAYRNSWVSREALAFLFWSDIPEANARRNLRNLVLRVNQLSYTRDLEVERSRLRWQVATDVDDFKAALSTHQLYQAVRLGEGELLQRFSLEAPEFASWLETERETLNQSWQKAVFACATEFEADGDFVQASDVLETLLMADPGHEEALQMQVRLLHADGHSDKALQKVEHFKTFLKDEFGGELKAATLELVAHIQASPTQRPSEHKQLVLEPKSEKPAGPGHNLPVQFTQFVGRTAEKTRIAEQLADPACRLLSLVGPGGIGKTRLALAAAEEQLETFGDGVFFVALAPVSSPEQIVYAVADALELSLSGQQEPKEQVLAYLANKNLLLVLDNLEHMLSGVTFISDILEAAPGLKVLATSRERLHLKAEWLVDLRGLNYPSQDEVAQAEHFDAVKLFVQSAKRLQPEFSLDERSAQITARICQLVAGMPLAIELASGWLRLLSLEEILSEIEQGLDVLEASTRDAPERHQSIRAVFDSSWQFLTDKEQEVLSKLAIFRGGFLREAASRVAGASLPSLASLVHKSFLTHTPNGRYERHPLVYQCTYEKLKERQDYTQVQEQHRLFYTDALRRWGEALSSGKQTEILHLLGDELANIRAAFHWAVREKKVSELHHAFGDLELYFVQANRFREGLELFVESLKGLDVSHPKAQLTRGTVLVRQAHFHYRLGQFDKATETAEEGLNLLESTNDKDGLMKGYNMLGITSIQTGDYPGAQRHLEKALALAKAERRERVVANYTNNLGLALTELGEYDRAEQLFHEASKTNQDLGNHLSRVRNLNNLGDLALLRMGFQKARDFFQAGLDIATEMDFQQPLPHLLNGLASSALGLEDYSQAEELAQQAQRVALKSGERSIQIEALENLGKVMLALNNPLEAQRYFLQALDAAWQIKALKFVLPILLNIAALKLSQEKFNLPYRVIRAVLCHPAANKAAKAQAEQLFSVLVLRGHQIELGSDVVAADEPLETLVPAVLKLQV